MDTTDQPPSTPRGDSSSWSAGLPDSIRSLWEDVCRGMDSGSFTLVAHGTRTLVDRVARDLVGEARSFAQSVRHLKDAGYIGRRESERLSLVVEAGNATAHRSMDLTREHACVLVHIIESLLRSAYLSEAAVESLRRAIPRR